MEPGKWVTSRFPAGVTSVMRKTEGAAGWLVEFIPGAPEKVRLCVCISMDPGLEEGASAISTVTQKPELSTIGWLNELDQNVPFMLARCVTYTGETAVKLFESDCAYHSLTVFRLIATGSDALPISHELSTFFTSRYVMVSGPDDAFMWM